MRVILKDQQMCYQCVEAVKLSAYYQAGAAGIRLSYPGRVIGSITDSGIDYAYIMCNSLATANELIKKCYETGFLDLSEYQLVKVVER